MKSNQVLTLLIGFTIIVLSCTSASKKIDEKRDLKITYADTIRFEGVEGMKSDSCYILNHKFRKCKGIFISNYYTILDSLTINPMTSILILSPSSLEADGYTCKTDKSAKRLLVEIDKSSGKIRKTFTNLISDAGGLVSSYNGIKKETDGFTIIHEAGAKYSWTYSVRISYNKTYSYISKITKVCSVEGKNKSISRNYNISLDKFNVVDTLNADCHCDKMWEIIEKKK